MFFSEYTAARTPKSEHRDDGCVVVRALPEKVNPIAFCQKLPTDFRKIWHVLAISV